jgi:hypothetical protein
MHLRNALVIAQDFPVDSAGEGSAVLIVPGAPNFSIT